MNISANIPVEFNLWLVPKNHAELQRRFNSSIQPHVPLVDNISTGDINKCIEFFPRRGKIGSISADTSLMRNGRDEFRLSRDCTIYGVNRAPLVIHELYSEINLEEYRESFEHYHQDVNPEEEFEATLKLALRSTEYPFDWQLIDI